MTTFQYLSSDQKTEILKRRALELEADLYTQQTERELGEQLELEGVVEACNQKIKLFEAALDRLYRKIEDFEEE